MLPPAIVVLRISRPLWDLPVVVPLVLLWPLMLLAYALLLVAGFAWNLATRPAAVPYVARAGKELYALICAMRGARVCVQGKAVRISVLIQ